MGCRHYFFVDRLEDLFDEGGSRSSWRAHDQESFQLVSQLHVAIRMFWSRSRLPLNALIGSKQRVSPFCHLFNFWAWHRHWMGINPTQIFTFSSLTVAWSCCSREVDELDEDVGRLFLSWRCHWCWRMRTGGRNSFTSLEPRSERSSPYCTVFESCFLWDVVFDRSSTHKNIFFSSQSFPTDNTAGVFSRTFIVKNISNSLTYTVASSCVCTFSIGCYDCRRTTRLREGIYFSRIRVLFCWSYASTRRSRQILVPQV